MPTRVSRSFARQIAGRSKYRAVPTIVDGIRFASKAEARHYGVLKILERTGKITNLELQPRFPLVAPGPEGELVKVGDYVADFAYTDERGTRVIIDVKGVRTPLYKRSKKHFEAQYGTKITEIG